MAPNNDVNKPDWTWYAKHKERLDKDALALIEAGHLQDIGVPPGPTLDVTARAICTILDKHPHLATENPNIRPNGKPLTASQKRAQKRFNAEAKPTEVVEFDYGPDQWKMISAEDYKPPPLADHFCNGKKVEGDWQILKPITEEAK